MIAPGCLFRVGLEPLVISLFILLAPSSLAAQQQSIHELQKRIEVGWAKLRQIDESRSSYQVEVSDYQFPSLRLEPSRLVEIRRRGNDNILFRSKVVGRDIESVHAVNPDYAFTAYRKTDAPAWTLVGVFPEKDGQRGRYIRQHMLDNPYVLYFYPLSTVNFMRNDDLLSQDRFEMHDEGANAGGLIKVKVSYQKEVQDDNRGLTVRRSALYLLLDPRNHFVVVESENAPGGTSPLKDFRLVRQIEKRGSELYCRAIDFKSPSGEVGAVIRFSEFEGQKEGAPDQFRMPFYGLWEPDAAIGGQRGWPWWYAAAFTGFILGMLILVGRKWPTTK